MQVRDSRVVGALGTQPGTFLRRRYRCFSLSLSFLEACHDSAVGSLYGDSPAFLIFYLIYFFSLCFPSLFSGGLPRFEKNGMSG